MSKSNAFENALLKLEFQAIAQADIAQNDSSSPATTLTLALHTADPGEAGDQSTNEIAYTPYARVAVPRDATGFTVAGNAVSLAANADFPTMTAGAGGTATHWSVGTGVGNAMLYSGPITPPIVVANGVLPRLTPASTITED
jgi:hypothetical protein